MNPGKLDRKITYATLVKTETDDQDFEFTWNPVLNTWAMVRPRSGVRQLEAGEEVIRDITVFTTRYRRDFIPTKDMRILYKDRYYTIHNVKDIENKHTFYEIVATVTDENSTENAPE